MTPAASPTRDRSDRLDLILGICCAAALAGVLYAAFLESPRAKRQGASPTVGHLFVEENEVRRRNEGTLAWHPLHAGDPIYDRDAVFVGAGSRAVIALEEGARIDVEEGALVVVRRPEAAAEGEDAPLRVVLLRGTAGARAGPSGLNVQVGEAEVAAAPGAALRLREDRAEGAQIDVGEGRATVASPGATAVSVTGGFRARLALGAKAPVRQRLTVALLQPTARVHYGDGDAFLLPLTWSAPPGARRCQAEVGAGPGFRRMVARARGEGRAEVTLPGPGTYAWRVRCGGPGGPHLSEERPLRLIREVAPALLHPVPGSVVDAARAPPPTLSWTRVAGAAGYQLEWSREGEPPTVAETRGPTFRIGDPLQPGRWCVRVRARPVDRPTPWSERACFQVTRGPLLPAPELLAPTRESLKEEPEKRGALDLLWMLVGGVAHAQGPDSAIVLRWKSIPGARAYILEIALDPAFERRVLEVKVEGTSYKWPVVLRRDYYWRVRGVDALGREGRVSQAVPLRSEIVPLRVEAPADGTTFEAAEEILPVLLRWAGPEVVRTFRVEVALDPEFKQPVALREVEGTEWSFQPPSPGAYHWRVSARDLEGEALEPSPACTFQVVAQPPAPAAQRQRIVAGPQGARLPLVWSPRPVRAYELQLAGEAGFQRPAQRRTVRGPPRAQVQVEGPGRYLWRVRGLDPQTGWSAPARMIVRPPPPDLAAPEDGARVGVDGAQAPPLSWTEVPGSRGYEVELTSETGEEVRREVAGAAAPLEGLGPSRWRWRVRALHASGLESQWSAARHFVLGTTEVAATAPAPGTGGAPGLPGAHAVATVHLGAGLGFFHNLGGLRAARAALEVGWRPSAFARRFGARLAVGYFQAGATAGAGLPFSAQATLYAVPVSLSGSWILSVPGVDLVFSAGPSLLVTHATVAVSPGDRFRATRAGLGAQGTVGVERRIGPGAAYAEAGWQQVPGLSDALVQAQPSGLFLQAGYRWGVW